MHLLNWRKDPFKPALCCNRHAKEEWAVGTAYLPEPVFDLCYRSLDLYLVCCCRGFLCGIFRIPEDPAPDLLECGRSHKETLCSNKQGKGQVSGNINRTPAPASTLFLQPTLLSHAGAGVRFMLPLT